MNRLSSSAEDAEFKRTSSFRSKRKGKKPRLKKQVAFRVCGSLAV